MFYQSSVTFYCHPAYLSMSPCCYPTNTDNDFTLFKKNENYLSSTYITLWLVDIVSQDINFKLTILSRCVRSTASGVIEEIRRKVLNSAVFSAKTNCYEWGEPV